MAMIEFEGHSEENQTAPRGQNFSKDLDSHNSSDRGACNP
jgi:hypothetical protein